MLHNCHCRCSILKAEQTALPCASDDRYMLLKKPDLDAREGCFPAQMPHHEEHCCLTVMFVAVAAAQYCGLTILLG